MCDAGCWGDGSGLQESSRLTVHVKRLSVYARDEAVRQDWMRRGKDGEENHERSLTLKCRRLGERGGHQSVPEKENR